MILNRQKFLTDTLVSTLSQILLRLRGLIIIPVFARTVGADGYGIFTQLLAITILLAPFISLRLETAGVRLLSVEEDLTRFAQRFYTALVSIAFMGLIVSVLMTRFASVAALVVFGDSIYADLMTVGSLLLVTSSIYNYLLNYFRIVHRMKTFSVVQLVESLLGTTLMLLAVYWGGGVMGAMWALSGVKLFSIAGLLLAIGSQIGWFGFDWQGLKEMLDYSMPLIPNGLMFWTVNYADRICITQFLGVAAIGAYSASYSFGTLINMLIMPVGFVLFPMLSRLWDKGNVDEVRRYLVYVTRYYLFLSLPVCVGIAFISQPLLRILANSEFVTNSMLVFWIALGLVFHGLFQINVYAFHLIRQTHYITFILAASAVLNIALNLLLLPIIGLNGAALATAVTFLLMAVTALIYGQRAIGYGINWLGIGKSILATAAMAAFLSWFPFGNIISVLGAVILGLLVYLTLLFALSTFSKQELVAMGRIVSRYIKII